MMYVLGLAIVATAVSFSITQNGIIWNNYLVKYISVSTLVYFSNHTSVISIDHIGKILQGISPKTFLDSKNPRWNQPCMFRLLIGCGISILQLRVYHIIFQQSSIVGGLPFSGIPIKI